MNIRNKIIPFLFLMTGPGLLLFTPPANAADCKTPMQKSISWWPIYFIQGDDPIIYLQQIDALPETPFTPPNGTAWHAVLFQCSLENQQIVPYPPDKRLFRFSVCQTPSARVCYDSIRTIQWYLKDQKRTLTMDKEVRYFQQPYLSSQGDRLCLITSTPSAIRTHQLLIYQFDRKDPIKLSFTDKAVTFVPRWLDENTIVGNAVHSVFFLRINPAFTKATKQLLWKTQSDTVNEILALEDRVVVTVEDSREAHKTIVLAPDGTVLKEIADTEALEDGLALGRYCCCHQEGQGLIVLDMKTLSTRLFIPEAEFTNHDYNYLGYDPKNDVVYVSVDEPNPEVLAFSPDKGKRVILRASPEKPYFAKND